MPYEQFRLNDTRYVGPSEEIAGDQLDTHVGRITKPLADGATRCEPPT